MTPKELHDACHEACMECPQFSGYDDDQCFTGSTRAFGDIPKGGYQAVIAFWKDDQYLWEHGYYNALPQEVQDMFEGIEALYQKAIKEFFK